VGVVNWDAIGAIGEVVGAIAVVTTLIYLSTQVRQSNRMSQAESLRSIANSFTSIAMEVAKSSDLRRVWNRLPDLQSIEELDPDEKVLLDFLLRGIFNTTHLGFEGHVLGLSSLGAPEMNWLQNTLLVLPVIQQWWEMSPARDGSYSEHFVKEVNRRIQEARPA